MERNPVKKSCSADKWLLYAMEIRTFKPSDQAAVIELWEVSGLTRPWNDPAKDILRKLQVQSEWFFVGEVDCSIVASVMAGYDGHRGWMNYLAVHPDFQRSGYGRKLVEHVEQTLQQAGCPKINLQVRSDNRQAIEFYESIGFRADAVVSLGKRLIAD